MFTSLYIGATGLTTHSRGMNVLGSNIANVNTVAYKKQNALFQDIFNSNLALGGSAESGFQQKGYGSQIGGIRTNFGQGSFEPSNSVMDLAIEGRGFFQVTDGATEHYTRAGNFRFTKEGSLQDPNGYIVSGIPIIDGVPVGGPEPIRIDFNDPNILQNPPKITTKLDASFNLGSTVDKTSSKTDPYFALASSWDGTKEPPLAANSYSYMYPMQVYDSEGTPQQINIYFDVAPGANGTKVFEYVVGMNPDMDGSALAIPNPDDTPEGTVPPTRTAGAGLLMAGTLTFSSSGELVDMSAFTPTSADPTDLESWKLTPLVNGSPNLVPQFMNKAGAAALEPQTIAFDLGRKSQNSEWEFGTIPDDGTGTDPDAGKPGIIESAADVGKELGLLPSMGATDRNENASTSYAGSSKNTNVDQDGYGLGDLNNLYVDPDGSIRLIYSNGINVDAYSIPIYRITSEDNLRREGMNHFSAPPEAGVITHGTAGEENNGFIAAGTLETSNVDLSFEMVNMIVMQRGFQTNSKTVTTADEMLQKAMEIKK